MADSVQLIEALDSRVQRREERREFFKAAFGMGALAVGGAAAMSFSTKAGAQSTNIDVDVLNFALNLEYLEAQFYAYAATGAGLSSSLLTGTGRQGTVITGNSPHQARQVQFTDPAVRAYAQEIAADEIAHVTFLRSSGALGTSAVSMPTINISGDASGPFTAAASAAGVPLSSDGVFDPYASDENFLLGAYIFEDVGVTAYKGASPLITNKTFLQAAAGILAVEAYHAAIVRTTLYAKGIQTPALITAAQSISNARDTLDGTGSAALGVVDRSAGRNSGGDLDQGITPTTVSGQTVSNIVPLDANGIAYSRTAGQVLNIVYLNLTTAATTMGGFFPNGVNGNINASIGTA
ncbi:ferritin-like domain-containing protein [Sphingomonas sp. KR1UV-12]|uniref:Ferritin-like domain-containing protein n=1 Tax=Sphingomonas aurea TaxID=3063994 RepID=A0ABT9EL44_9SPHN|nr:ferritin-like domain-containing protein [Sphingomonas sp. KR1UV-12]MDP1027692.1 ferritin-like domain-containing protein [Sphingomonas sp. KR1UV-12]